MGNFTRKIPHEKSESFCIPYTHNMVFYSYFFKKLTWTLEKGIAGAMPFILYLLK